MADVHYAVQERRVEPLPPHLTIKRACEVAGGCCRSTLYKMIREELFLVRKMGGRTLIDTASFLQYLANLPKMGGRK